MQLLKLPAQEKQEEPTALAPVLEVKQAWGLCGPYPNGSMGVRQKFGSKSQIFSVYKKGVDKLMLRKIAEESISKLEEGALVLDVKVWIQQRLSELA